jgi:hypothetical protein
MDNSDTPLDKAISGCLSVFAIVLTVVFAMYWFSQALNQ